MLSNTFKTFTVLYKIASQNFEFLLSKAPAHNSLLTCVFTKKKMEYGGNKAVEMECER